LATCDCAAAYDNGRDAFHVGWVYCNWQQAVFSSAAPAKSEVEGSAKGAAKGMRPCGKVGVEYALDLAADTFSTGWNIWFAVMAIRLSL